MVLPRPPGSSGHTPGLSPFRAGLGNPLGSEAPNYPLLHPSSALSRHGPHGGGTFSKLPPHNGHTRGLPPSSTVTLLGSPFLPRLRPGLGLPSLTTTPSHSGTHPKASRLELTGGKGGVAAVAGEHSPGGGVMVSCPSRFFLDLSHCAKPNLPGTKMVGRKLWRKRESRRVTSSGCAGDPNNQAVSLLPRQRKGFPFSGSGQCL